VYHLRRGVTTNTGGSVTKKTGTVSFEALFGASSSCMFPKIACSLPLPDPLSPSPFLSFPMSTYTVLRLDKGAWSEKAVASTTPAPNTRRQKGAEKRAMGSIGF